MAALPGDPVVAAWRREVLRYWDRPRELRRMIPDDPLATVSPGRAEWDGVYYYHWPQYLLEHALAADPALAARYASGAGLSAVPCRRLRERLQRDPSLAEGWPPHEILAQAPLHKLDWRDDYPLERLAEL